MRLVLSYKIATGSETDIEFLSTGSTQSSRILMVFRPNVAASTITVGDFSFSTSGVAPSSQLVTAGSGTPPLIVLSCYDTNNTATESIDPRGFSPTKDGEVSQDLGFWSAWKIYNSSPANVTISMQDEGTGQGLSGYYLQVA